MKEVRIESIGTGYIGKAHAITYAQAPTVFNLRGRPVREMAVEASPELAAERAQTFSFNHPTGDRRMLVADPVIDVVGTCFPDYLHKGMALEVICHGKYVHSEKPLVSNAHDARETAEAAQRARVKTLVGLDYMKNPTAQLAKEIVRRGEIGEAIYSYDTHNEGYMAGPPTLIHWHCFKETAELRAFDDLVVHIINMAQYLVGGIQQVYDDLRVVVLQRPAKIGSSQMMMVRNEDQVHTMACFAGGTQGVTEASRVACDRRMELSYVIIGTKGATSFTQKHMAKLKLYLHDGPANRQRFRTLLVGPVHPDYGAFCTRAGHGIGFNDQKTVEVHNLVDGIVADAPIWPNFEEGWKVSRVPDAIALSYQEDRWLDASDIV